MSGHRRCPKGHIPGSQECSDFHRNGLIVKSAVLRMSESVVSLLTYGLPDDEFHYCGGSGVIDSHSPRYEPVCWGSGVIIECHDSGNGTYFAIILTAATIFKRTHDNKPREIKVDVYLSDGMQIKGEVVCCDFHYNLATIKVQRNFSFPIAKLKALDDNLSLDPSEQLHQSFQLNPHSTLTKILPGELLIALGRSFHNNCYDLEITPGFFREKQFGHDCAEVYGLKCCSKISNDGGPVINCFGEVIGIRYHNERHVLSPFLPTNVISRWWSHYKEFGDFRRPWLGMKICNLHAVGYDVLKTMPNIVMGVIVTRVQHGSPAKLARICCHDVIVEFNGIKVRSILEFFENMWENSGKSVKLTVVRAGDSGIVKRKRTLIIGDTTPDNFYSWCLPEWCFKKLA